MSKRVHTSSYSLKSVGKVKEKSIGFQFWDFAGQEVYYISHQFFINAHAIYLVVFSLRDSAQVFNDSDFSLNFRKDITRVDYWLQSIRTRSEKALIVLGKL